MPSVKPFRGLRYAPSRVELSAVIGTSGDPRHVARLLDDAQSADDGRGAPLRRARFRLAEWRRAGVLRRDNQPALYAVRRRAADGQESLGTLCGLSVDGAEAVADPVFEARLEALGVAVEPVVAAFDEPRVRRALENAVDREADAAWWIASTGFELWCVDEESTAARIATLLSQAPLTVEQNAHAWTAQAAWWRRQPTVDEDGARAGAFALAFLHHTDDPWVDVPVGAALAPLTGPLS